LFLWIWEIKGDTIKIILMGIKISPTTRHTAMLMWYLLFASVVLSAFVTAILVSGFRSSKEYAARLQLQAEVDSLRAQLGVPVTPHPSMAPSCAIGYGPGIPVTASPADVPSMLTRQWLDQFSALSAGPECKVGRYVLENVGTLVNVHESTYAYQITMTAFISPSAATYWSSGSGEVAQDSVRHKKIFVKVVMANQSYVISQTSATPFLN
jgi:hypothetical protein